ncbi:type I methionyl aminopeptidase [Actinocorallia sp. API 0066]|uniref:type I methionyl aminopeptidase n=1 Tax=Actinocorallia sp. API 0066 TaxID=2896846 RepID=UPI001E3F0843|nr:type I methionyl aminopeptidase [Actinocorallia sp. API 0066]MCD0450320.1 type I methionyl aminopeptidase [Actinocorallia sp. API 0066]
MFRRRTRIQLKTPEQIELMRVAGRLVGETLALVAAAVKPGVTTLDLDRIAEDNIRGNGGVPSFIGVPGPITPFPATLCTSVNEEIVHCIPRADRVLREGDVVSIDCGAIVDGWHGDAAVTVPVGEVAPDVAKLLDVTEESLWRGLAACRVGGRLGDIGHAVESYVRAQGRYGIVEGYGGHGIGTEMHMEPFIPNVGRKGAGMQLGPGMVFAIEPMVNLGAAGTEEKADGWTVVTEDGKPSAHFEHTVAITPDGPQVLTALDGWRERVAELG